MNNKLLDHKQYSATVGGDKMKIIIINYFILLSSKKGKSSGKEQKLGFVRDLNSKISFTTSVF